MLGIGIKQAVILTHRNQYPNTLFNKQINETKLQEFVDFIKNNQRKIWETESFFVSLFLKKMLWQE